MKKFVLGFIILTLLFTAIPVRAENDVTVDAPSNWAIDYIENVKNIPSLGVDKLTNNYQQYITRGEFAYLSVKLYEYLTNQKILAGIKCFKDTEDEWVLKAKRAGLVNGYSDKTYRPNNNIRREEIAVMFVNVLVAADSIYKDSEPELFQDDDKISSWARKSVYIAKANNIINGIGGNNFNPSGFTTREQALAMLSKAVSSVTINLLRLPKLGIDEIVLREVESTIKPNIYNSISEDIIVDKADYPFEPDFTVLGQWISVDLVPDPLLYNPEKPFFASLSLKGVHFFDTGIIELIISENRSIYAKWTKGLVMQNFQHEQSSSRYFIASVQGKEYLFLEWKSGDYIYRNVTPAYYVFTRK